MSATSRSGSNGGEKVIYKRRKQKHNSHIPHGSWKVAYADFVTAMMAFFLLMWIVASATEEQKAAMMEYFNPTGDNPSVSISGIIAIDIGGKVSGEDIKQREEDQTQDDPQKQSAPEDSEFSFEQMALVEITREEYDILIEKADKFDDIKDKEEFMSLELSYESLPVDYAERKDPILDIWADISKVLESDPVLKGLSESIKIEHLPEGLKIQVMDHENVSMFQLGDTKLTKEATALLDGILPVIQKIPHDIGISGHTDSRPYVGRNNYTNWELSADRAQEARRYLVSKGFDENRISRIEGRADSDPYIKDDPADGRNRRISILVLRFNDTKSSNR